MKIKHTNVSPQRTWEKKMSKPRTTITSLHLPNSEREQLQIIARDRMRSQSHLLRMALTFWLANGAPEVPQDFAFGPAGRTLKAEGKGGELISVAQ